MFPIRLVKVTQEQGAGVMTFHKDWLLNKMVLKADLGNRHLKKQQQKVLTPTRVI